MAKKENIVDHIYERLKKEIIQTKYMPGEILSENTLAESFGASRTPVREALKRLQQDNWVIFIPKVGVQVTTVSLKDVKEYFEVRKALERLAAQLAIKYATPKTLSVLRGITEAMRKPATNWNDRVNLDADFHDCIWNMSGNEVLEKYLRNIQEQEQRWWYYMERCNMHIEFFKLGEEFNIYENILRAIEERDEKAAVRYALEHVDYYIEQLKNSMYN